MPRFRLRQRLLSIGEDYDIEDDQGRPVYKVDGKVLRLRETFELRNQRGEEVLTIREKKLALRDSMKLLRDGRTVATVRKAWFTPLRDSFSIEVEGGEDLVAKGRILDHEYEIRRGNTSVARISKSWFTLRDTYGIDIREGEDEALILGITVAIDEMVHDPDEAK